MKKLILIFAFAALGLCACEQKEPEAPVIPVPDDYTGYWYPLSIGYKKPEGTGNVATEDWNSLLIQGKEYVLKIYGGHYQLDKMQAELSWDGELAYIKDPEKYGYTSCSLDVFGGATRINEKTAMSETDQVTVLGSTYTYKGKSVSYVRVKPISDYKNISLTPSPSFSVYDAEGNYITQNSHNSDFGLGEGNLTIGDSAIEGNLLAGSTSCTYTIKDGVATIPHGTQFTKLIMFHDGMLNRIVLHGVLSTPVDLSQDKKAVVFQRMYYLPDDPSLK